MAVISGDQNADKNDTLVGTDGDDTIYGLTGNDTIFGNSGGSDRLVGGVGDDVFDYQAANVVGDTIEGGEGFDTLSLVSVSFSDLILNAAASVERVSSLDTILGTGAANLFDFTGVAQTHVDTGAEYNPIAMLLDGDDTFFGGAGSEFVEGGAGDDVLNGGGSVDRFLGGEGADTLDGGESDDSLSGGLDDDSLTGGAGNDRLFGGDGDDILDGGDGNDNFFGGAGDDNLDGGVADDRLRAGAGNDTLIGGDGADVLFGGGGMDALAGGTGIDKISGGGGTDTISGGGGADALSGGGGEDVFLFDVALKSKQAVEITDFKVGADRFLLDPDVFENINHGPLAKDAFVIGTKAEDAQDRIVYDPETGRLWFDLDGSGRGNAVKFATVEEGLDLSHRDFFVI